MWRVKRVAGAVKSFLWQNWLPDWRRWCQWREILSVGEEGILSRVKLDWGRKMPSLTGQVNMWGANNEHHHVCPHVRAGLKPGLPSKKILEQKHVRCPPVLIQACHRRLISPKLISLVDGQTEIRKKKEIEVWRGRRWRGTTHESSRTESRCSTKSRQSRPNSLRWEASSVLSEADC